MGMLEKVQALLTITGQAGGGGGGGGGDITVDATLSNTSTNPIQNQWLGKRMGATETNSVQIGYDAKAGKTKGQAIDGADGDNGLQVAVGDRADGSFQGAAVGYGAKGYSDGAAVGCNAIGNVFGAAVGSNAYASNSGAAVGYNASGASEGVAVGCNTYGAGENRIAIGNNANASADGAAVFGARSTNAEPYSTKVSAYNKNTGSFLSVRIVAGSSAESSYFDFYHEDTLSGVVTGRRISAANFFSMLDGHGATTDIPNAGGGGGGGGCDCCGGCCC